MTIKRSTLSGILSAEFSWLDNIDLTKNKATLKKNREPKWASLEAALLEWQIWYDKYPDSGPTTGDRL
jgi:hypothetical protein